ncbi:uncharacterized protein METZ01_LOCUS200289, partial [marine metagenome]
LLFTIGLPLPQPSRITIPSFSAFLIVAFASLTIFDHSELVKSSDCCQ